MPLKKNTPSKRIIINRTQGEWEFLEKKIKDEYGCNLHSYLHRKISTVARLYEECPSCVSPAKGDTKRWRHDIPTDTYQLLEELSIRMKQPIASIISNMLLTPLLSPEKRPAP